MKLEIADVRRTLEYGHSHDLARKALPFTLGGILLGLFVLTSLDGSSGRPGSALLGSLVIGISLAFVGIIIYRRTQPSVASIVISPDGVLFRDLSGKTIPWNEIREIGTARVKASRDFFSTKVTKLVVSERYYRSLDAGWRESVVSWEGNPSEIYLSYYHALPFDEFQEAMLRRWHAFSGHAEGHAPSAFAAAVTSAPGIVSTAAAPRRGTVSERVHSFAAFRAFGALIRASSPVQLVVMAVLLAGILALLTNNMGLWSTAAQERGRAKAAEWRAWNLKQDAERKELDDSLRRNREMWDRTFKCMDRGQASADPNCMTKAK